MKKCNLTFAELSIVSAATQSIFTLLSQYWTFSVMDEETRKKCAETHAALVQFYAEQVAKEKSND